jgi:hypothetical protein
MTLANVGLLADCWLIVGWQPTSKNVVPVKDIGIYMYVCWFVGCFWAFLFSYPFFHKNGPREQPTNQQTNIRPKFLEILCAGKDLNVGCTRQHST